MRADADTVIQYVKAQKFGSFEEWFNRDFAHWRSSIDSISSFDLSRISRALGWKNKRNEPILNRKGAGARYYLSAWDDQEWQKLISSFPSYSLFREHKLFYDVFRKKTVAEKNRILKPLNQYVKATNENIWRDQSHEKILQYAKDNNITTLKELPSGAQKFLMTAPGLVTYVALYEQLKDKLGKISLTRMRTEIERRKQLMVGKTDEAATLINVAIGEIKNKFPTYGTGVVSKDCLFRTWVSRFAALNVEVEFRMLVQMAYGRLADEAKGNWLLSRDDLWEIVEAVGLTHDHMHLFPDLYRLLKGKLLHTRLTGSESAQRENEERLATYYRELPIILKEQS